jgi:hypothetical protein
MECPNLRLFLLPLRLQTTVNGAHGTDAGAVIGRQRPGAAAAEPGVRQSGDEGDPLGLAVALVCAGLDWRCSSRAASLRCCAPGEDARRSGDGARSCAQSGGGARSDTAAAGARSRRQAAAARGVHRAVTWSAAMRRQSGPDGELRVKLRRGRQTAPAFAKLTADVTTSLLPRHAHSHARRPLLCCAVRGSAARRCSKRCGAACFAAASSCVARRDGGTCGARAAAPGGAGLAAARCAGAGAARGAGPVSALGSACAAVRAGGRGRGAGPRRRRATLARGAAGARVELAAA